MIGSQDELREGLSRRTLIGGIATGVAIAVVSRGKAFAAEGTTIANEGRSLVCGMSRCQHASAPLGDGMLLVCGGHLSKDSRFPTSSVQIFDANGGVWWNAAPMQVARARHSAVLLPDGRVAVMGGLAGNPLRSVEIYDLQKDEWTSAEGLQVARCDHSAVLTGSGIVVVGGLTGTDANTPISSTELYVPVSRRRFDY
jgi:hypothetical protein